MKKNTILLAFIFAICFNGMSQTVADLGTDWTGTSSVAPVSGTLIEGRTHNAVPGAPFTVYAGTANELLITATGPNVLYKYWAGDVYKVGETYGCLQLDQKLVTNYIEVSLTANSSAKKITAAKLNGTSLDATVGRTTNFIVMYSDKAPFDVTSIIGYISTSILPEARNGGVGVTLTVPEGTKSFRIMRKAFLNEVTASPLVYSYSETAGTIAYTATGYGARFAYISATIASNGGTTELINNQESLNRLTFVSNNGILKINAAKAQNTTIYSLVGATVKQVELYEGVNTVNDLKKGVYIINSQKIVVK